MILDPTGRYALSATADALVRYDRRWRRTARWSPYAGETFTLQEGAGHCLCVRSDDGGIRVDVRSVEQPDLVRSSGAYVDGKWLFEGESQAWSAVPEYILVDVEGNQSLIRIADGAEIDPLEGWTRMSSLVGLPGSRLIVLAGSGEINVYDPTRNIVTAHFTLAGDAPTPCMRLGKGGEVIWLDDVDTLMQFDTRSWEVVDAAGPADPEATLVSWALSADERWIGVVNGPDHDVLLLDATTLLPLTQFVFLEPVDDIAVIDQREVVGFRASNGTFFRPRKRDAIADGQESSGNDVDAEAASPAKPASPASDQTVDQ